MLRISLPPQKYWCFLNKERSCFERHYDDFSSRIALMMKLLLLLDFFWKRKTQKTTALILLVVAQSGTFKSVRTEKKTYIALSAPGNKARMYSDLTRATYRPEIITKLAAFFRRRLRPFTFALKNEPFAKLNNFILSFIKRSNFLLARVVFSCQTPALVRLCIQMYSCERSRRLSWTE